MRIVGNQPIVAKIRRKEQGKVDQVVKVTTRRRVKRTPQGTIALSSVHTRTITLLLEYWNVEFEKATGLQDNSATEDRKRSAVETIYQEVGNDQKVQRLFLILLRDHRASWVNNKTLIWLEARRNRTFLAPLLIKNSPRVADFKGQRELTRKITFRR